MKCVKDWVETVAVPNVVMLRAAELALPGPLDTTWTENLAGALQAEAAMGKLLASRTIKMEIPDTPGFCRAGATRVRGASIFRVLGHALSPGPGYVRPARELDDRIESEGVQMGLPLDFLHAM